MNLKKVLLFLGLVGLVLVGRLSDHPANFAPVAGAVLVASVYLGWRYSALLGVAGMLLSDYAIGFYDWRLMLAVYGSFMAIALLGALLNRRSGWLDIAGTSILGSLLFFGITNAAVWAFGSGYVHNFSGLMRSYVMGLPFLKGTLAGDLFYTGVLFGVARSYSYLKTTSLWTIKLVS
ncbi:hypothetical protein HY224_02750 [Candidatus Uhrbacteria bacterium]|nr:hypothetical protein [Candidatus Uhrbacteria bacterium]